MIEEEVEGKEGDEGMYVEEGRRARTGRKKVKEGRKVGEEGRRERKEGRERKQRGREISRIVIEKIR